MIANRVHKYLMITPTNYTVDTELFQSVRQKFLPKKQEMKITINQPTGNFFYDVWALKDEYKGTSVEALYNSLPVNKGEARIIILEPNQCYQIHADIDDRYHLNVSGEECYLIDLIREHMYPLAQDGIWYNMDAGLLHTATNFGRYSRIQLVVRQLLKHNRLIDPMPISVSTTISNADDARFLFDSHISPWLNEANKLGIITNFSYSPISVKFDIEKTKLESLKNMLPDEFKII